MSVEQSFTKIYDEKRWGNSKETKFFSGRGSHDENIVAPYVKVMVKLIQGRNQTLLDLGCGDFNVGSKLAPFSKDYIAADIVEKLIIYNSKKFAHLLNTKFIKLSISEDLWPSADVVILRQVLQHLSNQEIIKIIPNFYNYKHVIITEAIPITEFEANKENFTGPDIRLSINSGIVLDLPPFNLKYLNKIILLDVFDERDKAIIRTVLYEI